MDSPAPIFTKSIEKVDLDLKNKKENENKKTEIYLYSQNEILYYFEFLINENEIQIKCNNTENGKDTIYFYNLTLDEIKRYGPYNTLSTFYKYLKTLNNKNCKIEEKEQENCISLSLLLDNSNSMNIQLSEYINPNDALKRINNLERENKNLKNKINVLESNLNKFLVEFENYKNMMELNCFYNSFDLNAYKLEQLFSSLESNIMLNRKEFGLINKGIYQLFNKNITNLVLKYNSNNNFLNPSEIQNIFKNIEYSIVFIYTTDKKRFGAFVNNKNQNDMNNNNMNNNTMNNNMNNNNMNYNMNNNTMNNNMNNNNMNYNMNNNNMNNNMNNNNMNYNMNNNNMNNNMNINEMNNNMNNVFQFNKVKRMRMRPTMIHKNLLQNNINIFSSQCLNHYFVFSLDALKIYYSNNEGSNMIPKFSILFDINREVLYGKDDDNNLTQFSVNQLSGKNEFNIKYFEIYEVQF